MSKKFDVYVGETLMDTIYDQYIADGLLYDMQLEVEEGKITLSSKQYSIFKSYKYALQRGKKSEGENEYL